ncbi:MULTISPECIES: terminase small subunit [unclassified Photorhabdus]|uniref:terminase small subunit n=1 Tax=unclassified Photorhabdus TaxID=2620880 RepID=UPI000DCC1453|nr:MULTISPECIES: terminase small subunit [unclassified Photorhabdus]RAW93971.1 terminase small subunit [Photorhabdus sp. S9-53]RAW94063.1 terminase small subunit [Photorhabdus sp. S10-54]RAW97529.1 terminase small subunit [Photorhabdus sp. S8-52]
MAQKKVALTDEQKILFDALTTLQKKFVTHLLEGANQTEAYRKAGGKAKGNGERSKANQLVTNSNVKAFLQSVQYETVSDAIMTHEEALERLTVMGRTSIADLATFGTHVVGEDENGNPISQTVWAFKNSDELNPEHLAAISELVAGKDGLKIKLHDPKAAIKQLSELQGWEAPKKTELTGKDGGAINIHYTSEDYIKAQQALENILPDLD